MVNDRLYQIWLLQLQTWATEGTLLEAALRALRLKPNQPPRRLTQLVEQLAAGESCALPPIEILPNRLMPGAACAYANSSKTIFATLKLIQNKQNLLLVDSTHSIHTTLHNTSLDALLLAQPELVN